MVQAVGVHSVPEQESGSEQQSVDGKAEVTQPNGAAGLDFVKPFNMRRSFL